MPDDSDTHCVICVLADGNPRPDHAATQLTCEQCRRSIWFSYSSAVAMLGKEYRCLCCECARSNMQKEKARGEKPKLMPPTTLQTSELIQALRKTPHR